MKLKQISHVDYGECYYGESNNRKFYVAGSERGYKVDCETRLGRFSVDKIFNTVNSAKKFCEMC